MKDPIIIQRKEFDRIEDFYFKSEERILILSGPRGSGKTTLVLQFLEKIKEQIKNNYIFLSDSNSSQGLSDLIDDKTKLLIIDDFNSDNPPRRISSEQIRHISDKYNNLKIIIISNLRYSSSSLQNTRFERTVNLELSGLNEREQKEFFNKVFRDFNKKIKISDFEKIISAINPTVGALVSIGELLSTQIQPTLKILSQIQNSYRTTGLIDLNGNPLDLNSSQANDISRSIRVVNKSLITQTHQDPDFLYRMSPRQFEELVAELLSEEGYQVNLTQATRDGGKDIFIAHNNLIGDFLYYIECKRYAKDRPVGVNLVRELYGTIAADRATAGILVTTSYFSPDAITYVNKLKHQMSLKDYIVLQQWIDTVFKRKYGA